MCGRASREKLYVKQVFANITLNISLSFRRSSVLYSEFAVVVLAPVNITKSLGFLCVYLRKLQKNTPRHCIWKTLFHPGVSCFPSQRKRAYVSLCWSSSSMLESLLCSAEGFPWLCVSACCFYFLWKLQFVPVSENTLSWLLLICAQKQMKSMMKREHFLPNKKRVRSEKQIYFLTAFVANVSLQTLGTSRH